MDSRSQAALLDFDPLLEEALEADELELLDEPESEPDDPEDFAAESDLVSDFDAPLSPLSPLSAPTEAGSGLRSAPPGRSLRLSLR